VLIVDVTQYASPIDEDANSAKQRRFGGLFREVGLRAQEVGRTTAGYPNMALNSLNGYVRCFVVSVHDECQDNHALSPNLCIYKYDIFELNSTPEEAIPRIPHLELV